MPSFSRYASFMDERAARVGKNEALFRNVNERIEQLNESFAAVTDRSRSFANVVIQAA
jgi:hypothetical protein